jgi:squalene-hopene/tetraprenyl-beta-curcumene cyclase
LRFGKIEDFASRIAAAVDGARKFIFSEQHEDGYWCGELEADTTLESDYILLHTLLGTSTQERFQKCANYILRHQNEDGGWGTYTGRPSGLGESPRKDFGIGRRD